MSVPTSPKEIDSLLTHFSIHAVSDEAAGGLICGIDGFQNAEHGKELAMTIGTSRQIRTCPVSQDQAQSIVSELGNEGRLPKDRSFRNAAAHLIVRFSDMYVESGIDAFNFASIHLHPTSYELGKGEVWRTQPLHLKPRRKHNEPVFHSSFPHVPGMKH